MPTMPALTAGSLGADTNADKPSNTPRTPPSTRPSTGLLIGSSLPLYYASADRRLAPEEQHDAHGDIGEDQGDWRPVGFRQPGATFERRLAMGEHGCAVGE